MYNLGAIYSDKPPPTTLARAKYRNQLILSSTQRY